MKYSFVIAMYNAEKYIEGCLNSLLDQSIKCNKFEIIIVDDGSIDKSAQIVSKYKNCNIRYIKQNNQGCGGARNTAIKNAYGDYIVIVDADDVVEKDLLYNIDYAGNNSDIIKYKVKCIENNNKQKDRFDLVTFDNLPALDAMTEFCKTGNIWATPWGYAIKKDIYTENNLFFECNRYHEDFGLLFSLYFKAKTATSIDYLGYYYIKRENSITTDESKKFKRLMDFMHFYIFNTSLIYSNKEILTSEEFNIQEKYLSDRFRIKFMNSPEQIRDSFNLFLNDMQKKELQNAMLNINQKRELLNMLFNMTQKKDILNLYKSNGSEKIYDELSSTNTAKIKRL